jgi:hypothetical protein
MLPLTSTDHLDSFFDFDGSFDKIKGRVSEFLKDGELKSCLKVY